MRRNPSIYIYIYIIIIFYGDAPPRPTSVADTALAHFFVSSCLLYTDSTYVKKRIISTIYSAVFLLTSSIEKNRIVFLETSFV